MSIKTNNLSTPNFSVLGRFRRRIRHQNQQQSDGHKSEKELALYSSCTRNYHNNSSGSQCRMATSFDSGLSDGTLDTISSCSSTSSVNSGFSSSSLYSSCNSCGCALDSDTCSVKKVKFCTKTADTDSKCGRKGRRGGVQLKSLGTDFTIKGGEWKLWIDTLSKEELDDFKEAFALYDKKASGKIHPRQLGPLMRTLGRNPKEKELDDLMDELDVKGNGRMISFPQFVTTMAQKRRNSYEYVRETLEHLDPSGNGYIDCKDLRWDLANIGSVLPLDEINDVFDELDIDNDLIDCEELIEMVAEAGNVFHLYDRSAEERTKQKSFTLETAVQGMMFTL